MNTTPDQPADDVEGHMPRVGRGVHETPDRDDESLTHADDDLEGHGLRGPEALDTETTEDDAEGHGRWTP